MAKAAGIDFYDVDHTLLRGTSGIRFLLTGVLTRTFPLGATLYLPILLLRYRMGRMDLDIEGRVFGAIRDRSRETIEELARRSYAGVRKRIYDDARATVAARKAAGRRAVLATSSVDVIVRPLAEELGIDEILAVSFELEGGRYTGRLVGPLLYGEEKMRTVLDYIAREGLDPRACAFFSDSSSDLPLLEAVGEPVAVNPDGKLRSVAALRGWKVIKWS
jgi:HAD superfamily hydrolase (TIGR01490 family)